MAVSVATTFLGGSVDLAAQAEQLAGDLRYTQSLSMTHGQRYRINFASDRYWFSDITGVTIKPSPSSGATQTLLNNGVALASTHSFLVFDGNGAPYTTAVLPGTALASDAIISLTSGSDTRQVRVSPETGRVRVP